MRAIDRLPLDRFTALLPKLTKVVDHTPNRLPIARYESVPPAVPTERMCTLCGRTDRKGCQTCRTIYGRR